MRLTYSLSLGPCVFVVKGRTCKEPNIDSKAFVFNEIKIKSRMPPQEEKS
jgi:hypothetical protein